MMGDLAKVVEGSFNNKRNKNDNRANHSHNPCGGIL
jgi:hypothetical protein